MNFLESCEGLFNEIQKMRRYVLAGKITPEAYALQMGGVAQLEKQQKLMLSAMAFQVKMKKKIPVDLLPSIHPEDEMLSCPDQDGKFITRPMCLDYSGEPTHVETCQSCKQYAHTRKLMLP